MSLQVSSAKAFKLIVKIMMLDFQSHCLMYSFSEVCQAFLSRIFSLFRQAANSREVTWLIFSFFFGGGGEGGISLVTYETQEEKQGCFSKENWATIITLPRASVL